MTSRAKPLRSARLLIRGLVLGLAPVALVAPAAVPAAAAEPLFATVTTAYTSNAKPVVGQRFQIVGQVFLVLGDSPAPLPNMDVSLQRRTKATDPWVTVDTATTVEKTLSDGKKHYMYTFDRVADRTASFRVRYDADPESEALGPSASDDGEADPVRVGVQRSMPIRLLQPRPGRISLAGSVSPLYARQRVVVLRRTCGSCAWATFARPMTDAAGAYRVALSSPRRGAHYFVVRARASQGFVQSSSQQAKITAG